MKTISILKQTLTLILGFTLIAFLACSKNNPVIPAEKVTYLDNISNIGHNVITATYLELAKKASILSTEVMKLERSRTASNLDIARNAWRDARVPWEKSEGFLFGPVDTKGIDPAIDSWPVNVVDLDNVLASNNMLTERFVDALIGALKGFHTIEYLLWGASGEKQIADFTDREFEYLLSASENLKIKTTSLANSWSTSGENYVSNLDQAGTSNSIFVSEKAALQELVNGMIGIADEVGNGKINNPFSQQDLTLEESQFSHNSKNDFANNIRSISNVYNGKFNIDGPGIYDIIKTKDVALADRINTEINAALTAIENIPGTFSNAIFNDASAVQSAQNAVNTLQNTLESNILDVIRNL